MEIYSLNYISPVNHPESYLTGSTVESMIDRTKELGLRYFAITDHASLCAVLKGYMYGKKKGVKIIAGVELFFKDNNCPFIKNTAAEQIKYYKIVVHAKDQDAYQHIVKLISRKKQKKISVGGSYYPIYNWTDIEELCKKNITISTANSEDIVVKNLLLNLPKVALNYYRRLRGLVGAENFYPSIIPYKQDQYWNEMVEAKVDKDGTEITVQIPARDRVEITELETKNGKESGRAYPLSSAIDLTRRRNKKKIIDYVYINKIKHKVGKKLISAKLINSFQSIPVGDVQLKANKYILAFASKFGDKVLINNYSYYATSGDNVVQDMKLGEDRRVAQKQFMRSLDDSKEYLSTELGLSEEEIMSLVQNTHDWAHKFDEFDLKYGYRLPEVDGVPEELMVEIIKKRGRMKWDDPRYVTQFREEYKLMVNNGILNLVPYFLPILGVFDHYEKNGYLTGPARGSAGGFLISYLMGVTHIDPIKYGLSSARFLTIDRLEQGNLPDIDVDLESRVPLVGKDGSSGYLYSTYGDKAAQVSTRTLLRIKSAMLDANRFINKGTVEESVSALSKSLPNTPQGVNDAEFVFGYEDTDGNHVEGLLEQNDKLQKYAADRPKEWDIVKRALSLTRQNSRHACFAAGTLIDDNGKVGFIDEAPDYSVGKSIKTWYSGIQDTVIVSMNNGISIQCTPDHKFMIDSFEIEAKDLTGRQVSYKPFSNTSGTDLIGSGMAFALGWFLNNGAYIKSADRFEFYFTPEKDDEPKKKILEYLRKNNYIITQAKDREDTYRTYDLPSLFEITQKTYNKRLPREFWELDLRSQRNFMLGLFSRNGYCLSTRPIVAIKLTSKLLISDIAIWLNSNNIETSCSYSKPTQTKRNNGVYISRSTATLSIPHFTNKIGFEQLVGFEQTYKADRLRQIIEKAHDTTYISKPIRCLKVEEADKKPVWDFNEPLENVGYVNGILVHNCAYIISDAPIEDTVPVFSVGGVDRVTMPEHKQCEWAGLMKYDFLVVSAVKDIRMAIDYINEKNNSNPNELIGWIHHESDSCGCLRCHPDILESQGGACDQVDPISVDSPHAELICPECNRKIKDTVKMKPGYFMRDGKEMYIWDIPEEPEVFKMLASGKTETVFQLNTPTATPLAVQSQVSSVLESAVNTSLGRPGPMDFKDSDTGKTMPYEYIDRKFGRSTGSLKVLNDLIPETYGVLVFQEDVTKIARTMGMGVIESENVRIAMGKKKIKLLQSLKPRFIELATEKIGQEDAEKLWSMMATFARYGFNKCISGDTVLLRNRCGSRPLTVGEMYKAKNDSNWAKQNGKESVGKKYRSYGYGKCFSKKGDRLYHNNIVDIRYEGVKSVYKIITSDNSFIKATGNHKFPTPNGDICLDYLNIGDELFVNEGYQQDDTMFRYGGNNYPKAGECGFQSRTDTSYALYKKHSIELKKDNACKLCSRSLTDKRKEIHHKDGDHGNQDISNLILTCVSCHKKEHYKMGRVKQGCKGLLCGVSTIVGIEYIGEESVYDVEMAGPHHNFVVDSGIVTCNSHAIAYSMISYACAYMKYHYPLEWWAAVLSNAKNKEINEVLYKYVKDMVLPPDINLSTERMDIDYKNNKIRNKLSMITGIGNKLAEKIIDGRPYVDIQDFVNKKPCGPSMSRKLIHIGVLNSLFDKDTHLFDKMKMFENALALKEFNDKIAGYSVKIDDLTRKGDSKAVARTEANKKRYEARGPKEGIMDTQYSNIPPVKDFLIKKAVFPTINLDLHKLIENNSKNRIMPAHGFKTIIHPQYGREYRLLPGEFLQRIDNMVVDDRVDFACAGYIVDAAEFTYHKVKKALKIVVDSSGYLSEKVIWPDYETGVLEYPTWIRKGSVGIFFYSKKNGKPYTNINGYLLEEMAL